METKPKYAMQAGGVCHLWQSPDGNFKHTFLKLDFDCEPDIRIASFLLSGSGCGAFVRA